MHVQKWFKRGLVVGLSTFVLSWLLGQAGVPFLADVAALHVTLPLVATLSVVGLRARVWRQAGDGVRFTASDKTLLTAGTWIAGAGGLVAGFSSGFFLEGALLFNGYVAAGLGLVAVGFVLMAIPKGTR